MLVIRRCCNTCNQLKDSYDAKGWSHSDILRHSEQCIRDNINPFADAVKGEGCRINGYMSVNKVAGNFHIAHGESIVRDGRHIHQFVPSEAHTFNISHTLHSISFGQPYPNMPPNPLDKGESNYPACFALPCVVLLFLVLLFLIGILTVSNTKTNSHAFLLNRTA